MIISIIAYFIPNCQHGKLMTKAKAELLYQGKNVGKVVLTVS